MQTPLQQIISRKQALDNGSTTYFTGKMCPAGHITDRWVSTHSCVECSRLRSADWRADDTNVDHRREYRRQYMRDNPDRYREDRRRYQPKATIKQKQYRKNDPLRFLLYAAKARAKLRNIPFELTPADLVLPTHCPILGMPIMLNEDIQQDNSITLDRLVPELGYVKENVIVISAKANRIKNDATIEDVQRVVDFYRLHYPHLT